jgi:oxygen-dependent protoporphyrinogen oxidase
MGIKETPVFCRVFKNHKANVQYHVNHSEIIDSIMENLKQFPGLFLVGSSYRGIGIPDCIHSGNQAAEATLEFLGAKSE